jgi:plasmid stability protein
MAELHVRNIPPDLLERLREQARAEGRSMSAEAVVLLRRAMHSTTSDASRQAAIDRLSEIRRRSRLPAGAPSAEQLVRADRDAAR